MCNDLEKLNLVIDEVDIRYNYLIISAHIFNLLEQNKEFFVYNMDSKFSNGLIKVGVYKSFDVYLDLLMPPNEILLYCDRASVRDQKLDLILNDYNHILKEKRVSID
jgi:hypothetical protein